MVCLAEQLGVSCVIVASVRGALRRAAALCTDWRSDTDGASTLSIHNDSASVPATQRESTRDADSIAASTSSSAERVDLGLDDDSDDDGDDDGCTFEIPSPDQRTAEDVARAARLLRWSIREAEERYLGDDGDSGSNDTASAAGEAGVEGAQIDASQPLRVPRVDTLHLRQYAYDLDRRLGRCRAAARLEQLGTAARTQRARPSAACAGTLDTFPLEHGDFQLWRITRFLALARPSPLQWQFANAEIDAILPHIYGKSAWTRVSARVLRMRALPCERPYVSGAVSRRFGKTTIVAMVLCALLYYQRMMSIGVFSTGQRASAGLLEKVGSFWARIPSELTRGRIRYRSRKESFITYAIMYVGNTRFCNAAQFYPCNETALRGLSPDLVIFDEAQFVAYGMILALIGPILTEEHIACVMISSRNAANIHYQAGIETLTKASDPTMTVFRCIIGQLVCERCLKRPRFNDVVCVHHQDSRPDWISAERQNDIGNIMSAFNEGLARQELLNMRTTENEDCIGAEFIQRMVYDTTLHMDAPASDVVELVLAVDPSNSGQSYWAAVTVARLTNNYYVVRDAWTRTRLALGSLGGGGAACAGSERNGGCTPYRVHMAACTVSTSGSSGSVDAPTTRRCIIVSGKLSATNNSRRRKKNGWALRRSRCSAAFDVNSRLSASHANSSVDSSQRITSPSSSVRSCSRVCASTLHTCGGPSTPLRRSGSTSLVSVRTSSSMWRAM